jgi:hypothetical protein
MDEPFADSAAVFVVGRGDREVVGMLVEHGPTGEIFTRPKDPQVVSACLVATIFVGEDSIHRSMSLVARG